MSPLLFAINAVAPLIALVGIGYFLKRIGWITPDFSKTLNRLVFHIFLPAALFLNVYSIDNFASIELGYVLYAMGMVLAIFFVALVVIILTVPQKERRGALLQAAFRSNYALVGIPLAQALFGDKGGVAATLLSAVLVPSLNALAVISLSLFREGAEKSSVKTVLVGIAKNPLIRAIFLGLVVLAVRAVFVKHHVDFRFSQITPVYKVLSDLKGLSTPLALIALGAQFEFVTVSALKKEITMGIMMRNVVVPLLGLGVAYLFFRHRFDGAHFATFVAVFATPVAVSSVPMTQEMGGDVKLMGQLVVWSTLFSALTIFLAAFLLRVAGIL